MVSWPPTDEELIDEARVFARYLLGVEPPREMLERYAAGVRAVTPEAPAEMDLRVLELARSRRWALAPLDAASALMRPGSDLRKRLLLLVAILEASPEYASKFLPERSQPARLAQALAKAALRTATLVPVGATLLWWSKRRAS